MKKARLLLVVALILSLATALFALTACGESGGGVAATVNGQEIMEQEITDSIEAMRAQSAEYSDPTTWAQTLAGSSLTPETLRETVINNKVRDIVLNQEAESQGYTVNDDDINSQIEQTKATVAEDDEGWEATLQQYGYKDEQAYRDMLVTSDLQGQLYEGFTIEVSDDDLKEYIALNPSLLNDSATAEGDVPADTGAEGDVAATEGEGAEGTEGTEGAEGTEGTEGTEGATAEETPALTAADVDLSSLSADVLAQYKEQYIEANKAVAYQEWTEELVEAADVVINEMPADVPYNVDMSLAEGSEATTDEPTTPQEDTTPTDYSSPEAIEAAIAEGLVITDEVVGEGAEATSGSTVSVLYTGTLEDGTVFDSTANRDNEPFTVVLGQGGVIRGWDAGIVGMKVGGKRILTIPASLGYGSAGNGSNIPGDSTLIFEIELLEVS